MSAGFYLANRLVVKSVNMPQDVQHSKMPDEKWTYRPMYKAKLSQPPRREDVAEAAKILTNANRLLDDPAAYRGMAETHNPYGDGRASVRIVEELLRHV